MHKKIFEVEHSYAPKLAEFDEKRRKIVSGDYEPTEEECKYEFAPADVPVVDSNEKGIKNFWTQIFQNVDLLADMVTEQDEAVLEYLTDIRLTLFNEPRVSWWKPKHWLLIDFYCSKDIGWILNSLRTTTLTTKYSLRSTTFLIHSIQLIHWTTNVRFWTPPRAVRFTGKRAKISPHGKFRRRWRTRKATKWWPWIEHWRWIHFSTFSTRQLVSPPLLPLSQSIT